VERAKRARASNKLHVTPGKSFVATQTETLVVEEVPGASAIEPA
jgi:hypothetical protein